MSTDTSFGSTKTSYPEEPIQGPVRGQDHGSENEFFQHTVNASALQSLSTKLLALEDIDGVPLDIFKETRTAASIRNAGSASQALDTIELEIFKITEMARRWILENGLSPYKLALTAGTSPSQVHRVMEPGWTPSLKLARKIASSLPEDWVSQFERDCNACLPRTFYLHPSSLMRSAPINQIMGAVNLSSTADAIGVLTENGFNFCRYDFRSRSELSVVTARHRASRIQHPGYLPPAPRVVWEAGADDGTCRNSIFLIHRIPLKLADRTTLCTVHIAEFDGKNWGLQFWKIESSKDLTSRRQLDILAAYFTEFT